MQIQEKQQKENLSENFVKNEKSLWIFFDYSGTLVDTVKALSFTYTRYLGREFSEQNVKDFYKDFHSMSKLKLMRKYRMNPLRYIFGGKKIWEKYRQEEFWKHVKAFRGIAEVLNKIGSKSFINMAIVTHETELNDPSEREKILTHFGIPNVFTTVITDYNDKEKNFSQFIENNEITTGIFVGDTQFDVDIGKRQNCKTIGVTWGFSKAEDFDADNIVNNPKELEKVIMGWMHQIEQRILHGDPI